MRWEVALTFTADFLGAGEGPSGAGVWDGLYPKDVWAAAFGSPEMVWHRHRTDARCSKCSRRKALAETYFFCQEVLLLEGPRPNLSLPRRVRLISNQCLKRTQPKHVFLFTNLWSRNKNFHSKLCLEVNSSKGSSTMHISCVKREKKYKKGVA